VPLGIIMVMIIVALVAELLPHNIGIQFGGKHALQARCACQCSMPSIMLGNTDHCGVTYLDLQHKLSPDPCRWGWESPPLYHLGTDIEHWF